MTSYSMDAPVTFTLTIDSGEPAIKAWPVGTAIKVKAPPTATVKEVADKVAEAAGEMRSTDGMQTSVGGGMKATIKTTTTCIAQSLTHEGDKIPLSDDKPLSSLFPNKTEVSDLTLVTKMQVQSGTTGCFCQVQ